MSTENKTKFWVICCEDTEATRKIATTVADWQLPGVRSLVTTDLAEAETIAQSEYAIFITTCAQPSAQIKMSPLTLVRSQDSSAADNESPASQLIAMHERYGQSPQSWWFKLPATEVRAQKVQPVATEKSVAQGLAQVEIFVRNYTREMASTIRTATNNARNTTASPHAASSDPSRTEQSQPATTQQAKAQLAKEQPAKEQPAKRKAVLYPCRRI